MGLIAYRAGDYAAGISIFDQALAISNRLGERVEIAYRLHDLAILWLCVGDAARAKEFNRQGEILFRELGNKDGMIHSLYKDGHIAMLQDDSARAEMNYREALELVRAGYGVGWLRGGCLFGFAMVAAVRGLSERAARLWGAAEKETAVASSYWDAADRRLYALTIAGAEKELGPRRFAKGYAEGYAMSWEQAIEYALDPTSRHAQLAQPRAARHVIKLEIGRLTVRERQVAARIAQGESNREIAVALVVSERTVETHVTNILNKLGFTRRAKIRKWAVAKGLVTNANGARTIPKD